MTPLRLTWRLSTPVACSGYPIHLDDIVAFAKTRLGLRMASHDDESPEGSIRQFAQELPLEREVRGEDAVWKASALVPAGDATVTHGMRFWTSKFDSYDYAQRFADGSLALKSRPGRLKPYALNIDTKRGLFKNGYKFYAVKHIERLQAWCRGDEDELAELLDPACGSPVMWIGARGRSGLGRIASFEMVRDDEALHRWSQRSMPWAYEGAVQLDLATRPPYWDVANRGRAWVNPDLVL